MRGPQIPWQCFGFIGYGPPRQHLRHRAELIVISSHVMTQLYMPQQFESWAVTQKTITDLDNRLNVWVKSLPDELIVQSRVTTASDPRAKIDLALCYYSIKTILHRPCLCHIVISDESISSKEFNSSNARNCVRAATSLVDILPEDPSAYETYQLLPWWILLHYLGQATSVFILELSLDMEHFEDSVDKLIPYARVEFDGRPIGCSDIVVRRVEELLIT
ncbi:uncharacterized protein PV06_11387 [Exophiala oligosperma]|uniref:Uncharacterized protein n=1 Tax=Exophiala oligosperma TaxID=215243 RepID=A0A0D2A7M4_9EURO|nr:uncharacterized protein PV06_11387 [Exophiala oligosperma]KIW36336.1 hypothetical protein PV06_11387 [Exophiala oligosperma]